jgi:hypothetical protein
VSYQRFLAELALMCALVFLLGVAAGYLIAIYTAVAI